MDGWDGTEYQKCPSIFFIFNYVDNQVLHLLNICSKFVKNFLMGLKFWSQVGGGGALFLKLPYSRDFLNIWVQTCLFSFCFSVHSSILTKNSKTFFTMQN